MPRINRSFLPNVSLHIIQRGNNRLACFFQERDYIVYLEKLHEYSQKYDVAINSFVLMTNHVHLMATPADANGVCKMMQDLGRYNVRYINNCHGRTGTLWEGRYKASFVESERYVLTLSRYIELNPVRARVVRHPSEYRWSSFGHNAMGVENKLVQEHPTYAALGKSDQERRSHYLALFQHALSDFTVQQIRDACNKSWALGDSAFKKHIEAQLGHPLPPFPRGRNRESSTSPIAVER